MNWGKVVLTPASGVGLATLTLVGCCLLAPLAAVAADSATNAAAHGPLNGYHSEIAKSADTAKWVAVDLDRPQNFDAVRLFPARPFDCQPDSPGFRFPVRFKLEAAATADFSDARVLLDKTAADQPNPGTDAPIYHFEPATARFVRLTVTQLALRDGDNFAFALAEMQVLNGKDILSKGAKPFALDSIEAETGAWALANLTDGVLETVKPAESAVVAAAAPSQPTEPAVVAAAAPSQPTEPAVVAPPDSSQLYRPYWTIGTLYTVRDRKWPEIKPGEDKLERLPVRPTHISYIIDVDRSNPGAYHNFEPHYEPDGTLRVQSHGTNGRVTLFVDLGRVLPGTIEFEADPASGVKVSFETGEALLPKQKYAVNVAPDGTRKNFGPQVGWAGMRYVWIHFDNVEKPFTLFSLNGICQIRPSRYHGSFECDDEMLVRVWEMCAWSAHAVMGQPVGGGPAPSPVLQTLLMDRPDRHPWAGDSRVIQTAVEYVFGEYDLIRRANEEFLPVGKRPPRLVVGIPPYHLDWALAVVDHYRVSGDAEHMKKRVDDLLAVMDTFDPSPGLPDSWYFFDWDKRIGPDLSDQTRGAFWGKYVQFCHEAAWAAQQVGNAGAAAKFSAKADECTRQWRQANPDWKTRHDIHAITNLLLGGVLGEDDYQPAYDKVYSDRIRRCTGTPYFGIYVVRALTRIGRRDNAVQMLRDYWGTMIQAGATTTWEEWNPASRLPINALPPQFGIPGTWGGASLCQPAGAGPACWLIEEIVGIAPLEPGFRRVRIEPHTVDLHWAKGSAASPFGEIRAGWRKENSGLMVDFSIPPRCEGANVLLPPAKAYRIDGKVVEPDHMDHGRAVFLFPPGEHSILCEDTRE